MTDAYFLPFGPDVKLGKPFGVKPVDEWQAPAGEPIRAAGEGVVVFAGSAEEAAYSANFSRTQPANFNGDVVVLKMSGPAGPFFEYRNPSEIEVNTNDRVEGGQIIALAGEETTLVGALPWRFNLGSRTEGRVNPRLYQTQYWTDGVVGEPEDESTLVANPNEDLKVVTPVAPARLEAPVASKRSRRSAKNTESVVSEPLPTAPIDATLTHDASADATPLDSTPSDVAPPAAPLDSGVTPDN